MASQGSAGGPLPDMAGDTVLPGWHHLCQPGELVTSHAVKFDDTLEHFISLFCFVFFKKKCYKKDIHVKASSTRTYFEKILIYKVARFINRSQTVKLASSDES